MDEVGRGLNGRWGIAVRSMLMPAVLAERWLLADRGAGANLPAVAPGAGFLAKLALDEIFYAMELVSARMIGAGDRERLGSELREALALFEREGWLEAPHAYHPAPPPLDDGDVHQRSVHTAGLRYVELSFASGYAPHPGEPGRVRWQALAPNHTSYAWLYEHPGPPRPWMVCIPGYRMGHPLVDYVGFRVHWLHHRLGMNVVVPVLPLHGPRTVGWRSGDGFLTGDYIDTLHLQAHAMWDLRRLLSWLRRREPEGVGVYGLSLGGYTAALLAALEDDLDCVIAGIPAACFVGLVEHHVPSPALRLAQLIGIDFSVLKRLMRVVSPLAMPCRVPHERRFMFAGLGDRLVHPAHVQALWEHWERPRIRWYEGGHVSFRWDAAVRALLREAVRTSGLVPDAY